MRTEIEILKALSHILGAMSACPKEERSGDNFRRAFAIVQALSWVLKRPTGEAFAEMVATMEQIDSAFGITGVIQ